MNILDRIKNGLIRNGKKKRAYKVYQEVEIRLSKEGVSREKLLDIFQALGPKLRLVDRKKGASTYKLPSLITSSQSSSLALKWFLKSVKERKEKKLADRLFGEMKEIIEGKGRTLKRKEEYYKLAIHNRGFLRFLRKRKR